MKRVNLVLLIFVALIILFKVCGIMMRGFMIGLPLGIALGIAFLIATIPLRKKNNSK